MKISCVIIVLLVCGLCTAATAKEYTCPQSIKTDAKQGPLLSGFEVWHNTQSKKSSKSIVYNKKIDLYDGHPSEMVILEPDNGDDALSDSPDYWTLIAGTKYWMSCVYSDTDIELVKHLGDEQKKCQVKTHKSDKGSRITSLECN